MALDSTVARLIAEAAQRSGLGERYPGLMERVATIESAGNPAARNPSGAAGLFQFMPGTARQYGLANPYDPAASANAAAQLTLDNASFLSRRLGRDPTGGELYLAHQQGAGGASKLLANPDALAADLVGAKAVTQNGGRADETAAQFAGRWVGKVDGAGPKMIMPAEAGAPTASGRFGLAGVEPSAAPAPTMATPTAAEDKPVDYGALLKLVAGDKGLAALAQPQSEIAEPPRLPAPPPRRPVAFDLDAYLARLPR